jgi:transcriptional regulator with XRE-family HTH domain
VSDLLAKRREDRRAKALRLSMLGWTQEEIGERLGVSKPTVNEIVRKFNSEDSELFDTVVEITETAPNKHEPTQYKP